MLAETVLGRTSSTQAAVVARARLAATAGLGLAVMAAQACHHPFLGRLYFMEAVAVAVPTALPARQALRVAWAAAVLAEGGST